MVDARVADIHVPNRHVARDRARVFRHFAVVEWGAAHRSHRRLDPDACLRRRHHAGMRHATPRATVAVLAPLRRLQRSVFRSFAADRRPQSGDVSAGDRRRGRRACRRRRHVRAVEYRQPAHRPVADVAYPRVHVFPADRPGTDRVHGHRDGQLVCACVGRVAGPATTPGHVGQCSRLHAQLAASPRLRHDRNRHRDRRDGGVRIVSRRDRFRDRHGHLRWKRQLGNAHRRHRRSRRALRRAHGGRHRGDIRLDLCELSRHAGSGRRRTRQSQVHGGGPRAASVGLVPVGARADVDHQRHAQ